MNGLVRKDGSAFSAFVHLIYKQTNCFMGNSIYLLPDGTDGNDCFPGNRGVIKAENQVIIGQGAIFPDKNIQKNVGIGIVLDENSFFHTMIILFELFHNRKQDAIGSIIVASHFTNKNLMLQFLFCAKITECLYSSVGRNRF